MLFRLRLTHASVCFYPQYPPPLCVCRKAIRQTDLRGGGMHSPVEGHFSLMSGSSGVVLTPAAIPRGALQVANRF